LPCSTTNTDDANEARAMRAILGDEATQLSQLL
jgi:hypothetical protein